MHLSGPGGTQGGTGMAGHVAQTSFANWSSFAVAASTLASGNGLPHVETQAFDSQSEPQSASCLHPLDAALRKTCSRSCW
jgi:hypothetical protein